MPFFGAIDHLHRITTQERNPLNCCCLMNGRLILVHFSTETCTGSSQVWQSLGQQLRSVEEPDKHLDTGRRVTHGY